MVVILCGIAVYRTRIYRMDSRMGTSYPTSRLTPNTPMILASSESSKSTHHPGTPQVMGQPQPIEPNMGTIIDSKTLESGAASALRDLFLTNGVTTGSEMTHRTETFILSVRHLDDNGFRIFLEDATPVLELAIRDAILRFSKDKIALRDFALHTGGGDIISSLTSRTHVEKSRIGPIMSIGQANHSPSMALHPSLYIGDCWPFSGSQGTLGVTLSRRITPSSVTIDHAAMEVTLDPTTAPKDILVWGIADSPVNRIKAAAYKEHIKRVTNDSPRYRSFEGSKFAPHATVIPLAAFTYDIHHSQNIQTFPVFDTARALGMDLLQVIFEVQSNWGNSEFTCIYRVRIHGEMVGGM